MGGENQLTGQSGSKQISIFKDSIALQSPRYGLLNKLALEVLADKGLGTQLCNEMS
jgi:hypothetical protein